MSSYFIHDSASRFLRHLRSIENLYKLEVTKKKEFNEMSVGEFLHNLVAHKYKHLEAIKNDDQEQKEKLEEIDEEFAKSDFAQIILDKIEVLEDENKYMIHISSPILRKAYQDYTDSALDEKYNSSQFKNSLVVSLVIGLEVLISDVFKDFIHHIDVSNQIIKDKPLNFHELKSFDTIEDAKIFLLDQYIENLLRNSFDGWLKELSEKLKIDLKNAPELTMEIDLINETFQRRHIIVHNDGIVNDLYLKKVNSKLTKDISKGEYLDINDDYFASRIRTIRKFGLILLFKYGYIKHKREHEELFKNYHNLLLSLIEKDCDGARYVFKNFCDLNLDHEYKLMSQVNYFLSYKLIGSDEIDDEIEKFNTSALSIDFKMAKSLLLGQEDQENLVLEFYKTLDDDAFFHAHSWPLMKLVKKSSKIQRYTKRRLDNIIKKETVTNES